jgi:hypothetical protein
VSDVNDDRAFDEYLRRGAQVSERYRQLADDEVPPELDRRVLAQAHDAVAGERRRSRAWIRWSAPLALAASLVLVVSIVFDNRAQREVLSTSRKQSEVLMPAAPVTTEQRASAPPPASADEPAAVLETKAEETAPAPQLADLDLAIAIPEQPKMVSPPPMPAPAPPQEADRAFRAVAPATASGGIAGGLRARAEAVEAEETPARADAAGADTANGQRSLSQVVVTGSRRKESVQDTPIAVTAAEESVQDKPIAVPAVEDVTLTANRRSFTPAGQGDGPRGTIPRRTVSEPSEAELQEQVLQSDPQAWLEHIRQLRRDKETRKADEEWRRFREKFPEYPVEESDTARSR